MFNKRLFCLSFAIAILLAACGPARLESTDPLPLPSPSGSWHLSLTQSGGFAGVMLNVDVSSDGKLIAQDQRSGKTVTEQLPPATLAKLIALTPTVLAPTSQGPRTGCVDCFLYDLEITSASGTVRLHADDTTLADSGAEQLIQLLQQLRDSALRSQP